MKKKLKRNKFEKKNLLTKKFELKDRLVYTKCLRR